MYREEKLSTSTSVMVKQVIDDDEKGKVETNKFPSSIYTIVLQRYSPIRVTLYKMHQCKQSKKIKYISFHLPSFHQPRGRKKERGKTVDSFLFSLLARSHSIE